MHLRFINGDTLLDVVVKYTFLGGKLDWKMKYVNHIKYICSKISMSIGILYVDVNKKNERIVMINASLTCFVL